MANIRCKICQEDLYLMLDKKGGRSVDRSLGHMLGGLQNEKMLERSTWMWTKSPRDTYLLNL